MTLHQPPANVFYVCVSCFAREGPSQRHSAAEPQTMKKKSHSPNSHEITRKNCVLISVAATDAATQYGTGSGQRPDLPLNFLECCGGKHRPDPQQDSSTPANSQVGKGAKRSAPPLKLQSHSTLLSTTLG